MHAPFISIFRLYFVINFILYVTYIKRYGLANVISFELKQCFHVKHYFIDK